MKRRWLVLMALMFVGLVVGGRLGWTMIPIAHAEREIEDEDDNEFWDDDRPATISPAPRPEPPVTMTVDTVTNTIDATSVTGVTPESQPPVTTSALETVAPKVSSDFPWPWIAARSLGVASFLLLGILSITGILLTTGILFRLMSPATAWSTHRAIGSVLLFSVLGHITALLLDRFMNLRLVDVLVPFISPFQRLYMSLGIIGWYLLLLILASTLYTMTRYARFWRTIHFFAFPMYVLIFLHGLWIGTDAHRWWMQVIFWGSGSLVGAAVIYRLIWKYRASKG